MLVVAVKYIVFIMRADNHGEGGILALLALVLQQERRAGDSRRRMLLIVARPVRRRAALRRRHHHAGHLRAQRRRRPQRRDARRSSSFIVPLTRRHPVRALRSCSARHRPRRRVFGPIMALWFVDDRRARRSPRSSTSRGSSRALNPRHGVQFFVANGRVALPRARRGRPRGHRRRGALRRHGPLRQAADPRRLVRARAAGAAAQLLRPGRAAAARSRRRSSNPFFLLAPHVHARSRSSCSRRWRRSSRRRRSSRARSRSRSRPCSSATRRA